MRNYTARQNGRQKVICLCPSINKTQIGNVVVPIPYPVQQSLAKAKKVSRNVCFNRDQAFTSASHTRKVTGDAPGRLKGIISNTTSAQAAPKQHSRNIRINKKWLVRCGDRFTMNKNNTQGTLVYSPPPAGPAISDDGRIEAADDATPDTGLLPEAHDYHPGHLAEYEGHIRQTFADSQKNWRDFVSLWRTDPVGALVQQARKTQQALKETLDNIAKDAGQWATRQANQYTNWWHTHGQKAWQDAGLGTIANAAATLAPIALGTAAGVINPARKINAVGKIGKAVATGKKRKKVRKNSGNKKPDKKIPALRQQYVNEVKALSKKAENMRKAGLPSEKIARTLHADRRALGVKYKDLTPPAKLKEIHARNIKKYGDKLGPSIDYLRSRGKSWDDIIESASRAGGKDLGF